MSAEFDWRQHAACRGHAALFRSVEDPLSTTGQASAETKQERLEALADCLEICAGCPVREKCADYALTHDVAGVAGGLLEEQRKELRKTDGSTRRNPAHASYNPRGRKGHGGVSNLPLDEVLGLLELGESRDDVARKCGVSRKSLDRRLERNGCEVAA